MANICNFSMLVKGKHEDIEAFYNAMQQEGKFCMGRGAEADIHYEDDEKLAEIDGWCKWSVESSLIDNAIDMREHPERWSWGGEEKSNEMEFITLPEACAKWNLVMEVYSEEPGCEFQEHLIIDKGNWIAHDCVDYAEYYIGEYDTKEEAEEELGIIITDEEWEREDYVGRGGFPNWDFEI